MADENRKIILDIDSNVSEFDKELGALNSTMKKNKDEIKELSKDYENNAPQIAKLEQANKKLNESKRRLIKENETEKNSLNALRLQLAKLTKERNNTNQSTEEGAKRFAELQKQIAETTATIKEQEQAGGDFRRNVGNYGSALDGVIPAFGRMRDSIRGAITAAKAFIATPLGVFITTIVAALATLRTFFTRTQEGADKLAVVFAQLKAGVDVLLDRFADLGGAFLSILSGDFKEGINGIKDAFSGVTEEIAEEVALAKELELVVQRLRRDQIDLIVEEARIRDEISEARLIAEDKENKSIDERIKALQRALQLEDELADKKQRLVRDEIISQIQGSERARDREAAEQLINDVIEGRTKLTIEDIGATTSNLEDLENVNRLIAEAIGNQTDQFNRQRSVITRLNALRKEAERGQIDSPTADDSIIKASEDIKRREVELEQDVTNNLEEEFRKRQELRNADSQDRIENQKEVQRIYAEMDQMIVDSRKKAVDSIANLAGEETAIGKSAAVARQVIAGQELVQEIQRTISFATQAQLRSQVAATEGAAQTAKVGFPQNVPLLVAYAAQIGSILKSVSSSVSSAGGSGSSGLNISSISAVTTPQQPALVSQVSEGIGASTQNVKVESKVSITDIKKGLLADAVKVEDSSL